jgi:hypothetical protein
MDNRNAREKICAEPCGLKFRHTVDEHSTRSPTQGVLLHLAIAATALLGDRVRDESASDEEIELYNDFKEALEKKEAKQ